MPVTSTLVLNMSRGYSSTYSKWGFDAQDMFETVTSTLGLLLSIGHSCTYFRWVVDNQEMLEASNLHSRALSVQR